MPRRPRKKKGHIMKKHVQRAENSAITQVVSDMTCETMDGISEGRREKLSLQTVPSEIFDKIAGMLPVMSIVSLSKVCREFHEHLSFPNGNLTFYSALPPSMLMSEEHCRFRSKTASMSEEWIESLPASPSSSFSTPTATSAQLSFTRFKGTENNKHYGSRKTSGRTISPHDSERYSKGNQVFHLRKGKRVLALGGPYDPEVDYRREILCFKSRKKCCRICLREKVTMFIEGKSEDGSLPARFCSGCLEDYSITRRALGRMLDRLGIAKLHSHSIICEKVASVKVAKTVYLYVPKIDLVLRRCVGKGFDLVRLESESVKAAKATIKIYSYKIEASRRQVRNRIVAAAEQLWEGKDPHPHRVVNIHGIVVAHDVNSTLPGAGQWAIFRDRFCPTARLKEMLFDVNHLTISTEFAAVRRNVHFLPDPTLALRSQTDFDRVNGQWLTAAALGMLFDLVDFTSHDYCEPNHGGSVTAWIDAAKQWHLERLDTELASGSTITMQHIDKDMRLKNDGMHRGIANLRERLGLTRNPLHAQHLPEAPGATLRSLFVDDPKYSSDYQQNPAATEASVNKYFHHIAKHACNRCPVTSYLFQPIGLDGLLEHMRTHHGPQFWAGTFHMLG